MSFVNDGLSGSKTRLRTLTCGFSLGSAFVLADQPSENRRRLIRWRSRSGAG
jgi:hypothetical protein